MDWDCISKDRENAWAEQEEYHKFNSTQNMKGNRGVVRGVKLRRDFIGNLIKKNKTSSVLELGCNQGANLTHINKFNPDARLVGVDICKEAIRFGKEVEKNKADLRVGSIYDLKDFDDNSFDVCFTCTVLLHVPAPRLELVIKEMLRISKKFIFHIESHASEFSIRGYDGKTPHSFYHNFEEIYKNLGYSINITPMEEIMGIKPAGGADHFIHSDLGDKMLIK